MSYKWFAKALVNFDPGRDVTPERIGNDLYN